MNICADCEFPIPAKARRCPRCKGQAINCPDLEEVRQRSAVVRATWSTATERVRTHHSYRTDLPVEIPAAHGGRLNAKRTDLAGD